MKKKRFFIIALIFIIAIALVAFVIVSVGPALLKAGQAGGQEEIEKYLCSFGGLGIFVAAILQMVQVFLIFLPAAPIQIATGIVYGIFEAIVICYISFCAANMIIFWCARNIGNTIEQLLITKKEESKFNFLNKIKNPTIMVILAYIMPALPNGFVPYLAARTPITFKQYSVSLCVASLPGVILFCTIGNRLVNGDFTVAAIIFVALLLLAVLMIVYKEKITNLADRIWGKIK